MGRAWEFVKFCAVFGEQRKVLLTKLDEVFATRSFERVLSMLQSLF